MSEFVLIPLAAMLIVVVLPIWIIAHYGTRWRTNRVISFGDEKLRANLWETAAKMETRIDTLERILDDVSFTAPDRDGETLEIDGEYVRKSIGDLAKNADLSRFIL